MANLDLSHEAGLHGFGYDPRHTYQYTSRVTWPLPADQAAQATMGLKRSTTPLQTDTDALRALHTVNHQQQSTLMRDWQLTQEPPSTHLGYAMDNTAGFSPQSFDTYGVPFQASPTDYVPQHTSMDGSLQMDDGSSFMALQGIDGMPYNWQDFQNDLVGYATTNGLPDMNQQTLAENSPTDTYLEVRSLTSSSSDNGWATIDYTRQGAIFNPGQTLHPRTFSESSYSDIEPQPRNSWGSYVEVPNAINSPGTDSIGDIDYHIDACHRHENERPSPPAVVTTALVKPIAIKKSSSPQRSPTSACMGSPPIRRQSRKPPSFKATKSVIRRPSQTTKNETEKRVGRRKGPLRPDQRKQASEIRKLGACLRCRFLKKTCDKGEPCGGCKPSHARLWQVPCTRIDIKDIAYFMKDWKADYERHITLGFSVGNIKGFSKHERTLFITHGFGHVLPVKAREVYVRDERCFGVDWVETVDVSDHAIDTANLSAGMEGISPALLSDYLDRHIDGGFELFVDDYFEGTPFITQILKTAYRFWLREKTPVIRKALKLVLAYNLTQHITMIEGVPDEEGFLGKIADDSSKYHGKTVAPVMINFQVKCALADKWRELQKDILEELSSLYSSVYTRDKLKHWPTIFMLATILLAVWEEMQFDCHYRVPDTNVVNKFCNDMETTPVGVIVGLFSAISQKLPSFSEWDTRKHHNLLNSNPAVCDAMTEVREHVTRHDAYLRSRSRTTFDRGDFDSLANKFVSKLVIKAN